MRPGGRGVGWSFLLVLAAAIHFLVILVQVNIFFNSGRNSWPVVSSPECPPRDLFLCVDTYSSPQAKVLQQERHGSLRHDRVAMS